MPAGAPAASLFLYSANPWLKYHVQQTYYGDVHFVWCSEWFFNAAAAPSSTPKDIYVRLAEDVRRPDRGSLKIIEQRNALVRRVRQSHRAGEIGKQDMQDIVFEAQRGDIRNWRPILYVIARNLIDDSRIERVDAKNRASISGELRIKDLRGSEFEIVEF